MIRTVKVIPQLSMEREEWGFHPAPPCNLPTCQTLLSSVSTLLTQSEQRKKVAKLLTFELPLPAALRFWRSFKLRTLGHSYGDGWKKNKVYTNGKPAAARQANVANATRKHIETKERNVCRHTS